MKIKVKCTEVAADGEGNFEEIDGPMTLNNVPNDGQIYVVDYIYEVSQTLTRLPSITTK